MLDAVITWSLRHRLVVVVAWLAWRRQVLRDL